MADREINKPGFQGSETSSVEVTFYRQRGDPIAKAFGASGDSKITLQGRVPQDKEHAIVGLNTNKSMGPTSGSWSLQLKPSLVAEDLFKTLVDDDWVDISINRHGRKWHVIRGLVDDVRKSTTVAGSGATSKTYTVSGRDFTKVMEQTALYQDVFARSTATAAAFLPTTIFQTNKTAPLAGGVAAFVEQAITGYLKATNDSEGRTTWVMPSGMPEVKKYFIDTLRFWTAGYTDDPARLLLANHWVSAEGMLWPWVVERSDPVMTDLWTDVLPKSTLSSGFSAEAVKDGLPVNDSGMYLIVRDKPFPRTDTRLNGPWFKDLALFIVPRQQILVTDIGKTGTERFNAFFMAPLVFGHSQKGQDALVTLAPEWSPTDIDRHGIRRWDLQTIWAPHYTKNTDWQDFQDKYRHYLRDWHAINPYLLNGSINLAIGRPDIRVGHRVRIPGDRGEADQETYYIEGVSHNWSYGQGTRTTLNVTRGWIGRDSDLLAALDAVTKDYAQATSIRA